MRSIKTLAAAFFAASLLVACSDEQTTFNIENVPGRCTLQGQIVYNQGTTYEGGKFVYNYKPVANSEVFVTVDNSGYGNGLTGETTFTTTTDEQGNYTIEIPAPSNSITATVKTADFLTERSVVEIVNNKVVTNTEEVVIRGYRTFSDIHSNGIRLASFVCTECNTDDSFSGFNEYATLNGTVGQNVEYKIAATPIRNLDKELIGYDDARVQYCFEPAAKVDLILKVNYTSGETFTYNTTTDASGNFSLQVPVAGFPAVFGYELTCVTYNGNFTHYEQVLRKGTNAFDNEYTYYDYEARKLVGFYSQTFCTGTYYASYPVAAQVVSEDFKAMVFNPLNNGQELYGYSAGAFGEYNPWLEDFKASLEENNK
ncbi:MAG: hypothetical protein K2F91_01340 [Muribaculaceae bacterium]|nr:hypothetical protein [Muribaculaceae bacterium]